MNGSVFQQLAEMTLLLVSQFVQSGFGLELHTQNPLHRLGRKGAIARRTLQGCHQVVLVVMGAERQDLARLGLSLAMGGQQSLEEPLADRPQLGEGLPQHLVLLPTVLFWSVLRSYPTLPRYMAREQHVTSQFVKL